MKYRILDPKEESLFIGGVIAMPGTIVMTGRGGVYWRVEGVCLDDTKERTTWVFDLEPVDPHDIEPNELLRAVELPVPYEWAIRHTRSAQVGGYGDTPESERLDVAT